MSERRKLPLKKRKTLPKPDGPLSPDEWSLVLIDQEPLRQEAADQCAQEMAHLESLRSLLTQFEQEDQPLFEQWLMQTFGEKLTALRENDRILREKESLIREIEDEVYFGQARTHQAAYKIVMERRAEQERQAAEGDTDEPFEKDGDPEEEKPPISPEQAKALFHEYLQQVLDIHPNQLRKAEYAKMFAAFQVQVLGMPPPEQETPTPKNTQAPSAADAARGKIGLARIKEIYRILVRRLHPDSKKVKNTAASALWHEVQKAYETKDLERLETILALCETTDSTVKGAASISQMRRALQELRKSSQAVHRSLSRAKKEMAWGFKNLTDRSKLQRRLADQFFQDQFHQKCALEDVNRLLSEWSSEPRSPKPRKPSRGR